MIKRMLSLLLALCLVVGLCPGISATDTKTDNVRYEVAAIETDTSTDAKNNVTYYEETSTTNNVQQPASTESGDGDTVRYTVLLLNTEPGYTMTVDGEVIYEVSTSIETIKAAATRFTEQIERADGTNYVAIISFSRYTTVETQFTSDTAALKSAIDNLDIGVGRPDINAAYEVANELLKNVTEEHAIKNVILFTQSAPGEGESSEDGHYSIDDCTWYTSSTGIYKYAYANVAYDTAQTMMDTYNLYSIGLFQNYASVPEEGKSLLDFTIQFCKDVQNAGYINVEDVDDLEFVFGNIADSITADSLKQLYIDQHIDYFNSEQYESDILPGYTTYLDMVLDDALADWSVKSYNILDAINEFAALDVELDGVDMYELLLAQLFYSDQSRNHIQELYNGNLYSIVSETIKTLIDKLEPESTAQVKCNELFEKLKKYDFDSTLFQNTYSELMDELADQFTPRKVAESLEEFSFVAGLGIDAISQAGSTVKEIVEYIVYGQAYLNTSDDFRTVLFQFYIQSTTFGPDHFWERFGDNASAAWDSLWNYSEFEVALQNFIVEMETYRLDAATAIADKAKSAIADGAQSFVRDGVQEIAKECGDTILSYIPVLRWLPGVRDGLAAGQLLIDIFTNVDSRAYSVDMLKKLYIMAYVMDDTVDVYGVHMTRDDFPMAARFDESVSLYKAILSIAADYGAKYEEELLKAENGKAEIFRSQKKVSWYSSALSMMAVQKLMLEDIHCHSVGLLYDHHTQEITYDSTKLQIFVIACPVDVAVYDNDGKWIATLSNTGLNIRTGYEKYFFVCELDDGTGDYMKIAIVPNDYEVVLDGIGTGSMNVYMANYTEGNIDEAIAFYDVPVTKDTTGYFVADEENPKLEDLVVDETVYVGDDTDPGINPFTDVPTDSFYYNPILWALENGITTGTSATTFSPETACERGQVVTFLWRAAGEPDLESVFHQAFVDVKPSHYFYNAVLWAVGRGITTGTDGIHFSPFSICDRAQVVTFLWRAAGSPEPKSTSNPFTDVKSTDFFYKPVLWAVENGITNGVDATHFGPDSACNRAQVVTFLYRVYN